MAAGQEVKLIGTNARQWRVTVMCCALTWYDLRCILIRQKNGRYSTMWESERIHDDGQYTVRHKHTFACSALSVAVSGTAVLPITHHV